MTALDQASPEITAAEEAARRSRRGYDYQDLIAAAWCLEMFRDAALQRVACETQDDIVLTWKHPDGGTFPEFIQVKSDRLMQQWSVALFCGQETAPKSGDGSKDGKATQFRRDTSIFEKNARRDQGRRTACFRMVTRADVKELRVLTEPPDSRDAEASAKLVSNLTEALKTNTSLTPEDIRYWVDHAYWDVRGTDEAVFNANHRHLASEIQTRIGRLLTVVDLDSILHRLTQETRAMAMGKGTVGVNPDSVTGEELRRWLAAEVVAIPHFLGPAEAAVLGREERQSLARCEALWAALGVSQDEIQALARQPDVGAREDFFATLATGFHWVTAAYGSGKSLAMERQFQRQLADFGAARDSRVPVFLRAYNVSSPLQDAVEAKVRELQPDVQPSPPPLFLMVDAVDEAGASRAQRLLHEAYELSRVWPSSSVVVASTELPCSFNQFRRRLPELPVEVGAQIVSRFAGHEVPTWSVRNQLKDDSALALMCVLLGLALREADGAACSKGELLHRVVDAARKRSNADAVGWAEQTDRLCRIALQSTHQGGEPVRLVDLGMTAMELTPLYATRLVAEEAGRLVFTVATMRLWFAAQALRKDLVNPAELTGNSALARHWQEPLAIFAATTDFDSVSRYLEPLAVAQPAAAAKAVTDATRRWGDGAGRSPMEMAGFAQRAHRCLEAWLAGIGPLAPASRCADDQGHALKIQAGHQFPYTVLVFSHDPSLPAASALPTDMTHARDARVCQYKEPDEPAHIWRATYELVATDLREAVKAKRWELFDEGLLYEEVWNQAADLARVSRWFGSSVPWDAIDRFQEVFAAIGVWEWLNGMRTAHPQAFPAPHPPADNTDPTECWIPNMFSPTAALASAESIYSRAFSAYQRIVQNQFPNFARDLPHSAWWPCRLEGVVGSYGDAWQVRGWWVNYRCVPVDSAADAGVRFRLGTKPDLPTTEEMDNLQAVVARLRPHASPWFWTESAALNLQDSHPSTNVVREWLLSDLKSAGW